MFDFVRNNRRIVQLFLALIGLPFMFWGVDSYFRNSDVGQDAARVGDVKISLREFEQALNQQKERLRPALGGADATMLDSPFIRQGVLDGLVNRALVDAAAREAHLTVSNTELAQFIHNLPALQEDGKFSNQRYDMLVAQQGMSRVAFETQLRHDLTIQQIMLAVSDADMPGRASANTWIAAQLGERQIAEFALPASQYLATVKLSPDAVANYYAAHRQQFEIPERVRAEFVVLNVDQLANQVTPSAAEIEDYYRAHLDEYKTPEQRRASHILITVAKDAPANEDLAAREKAQQLLAQVKKNPASFAELAKKYSQDPTSANKGGDVGWIGRGTMPQPFEQAVFGLKENQISDLVRSDYGYHIIKLSGIQAEKTHALAEVKDAIIATIKRDAASKKFTELTEAFSNLVYEQSDGLKPAAEKFQIPIQHSDWLTQGVGKMPAPFNNAKLLAALFSADTLKNGRNTEAIEVAPGALVSARISEHQAATTQPLDSVKAEIEKQLRLEEAQKIAVKAGEERLTQVRQGQVGGISWSAPRWVSRAQSTLSPTAAHQVFAAATANLPSYVGAVTANGYTLYRISQVRPFVAADKDNDQTQALRTRYQRAASNFALTAWLSSLRERIKVSENKSVLEKSGS